MSSLDHIPKKEFFAVPEGYFDTLPARIRARIDGLESQPRIQPIFRYALAYALPLLLAAVVIFFSTRAEPSAESMLTSVETAALIEYLQESEITTDEMLESVDLGADQLEALENEVYDLGLDEVDTEILDSEFNPLSP